MNRLVSIIIPVYNVQEYLEHCLDSVVNQTYTNIEIILIDDGSTDESLQICKLYAKCDNRVKLIIKENEGVSIARNIGISVSEGEFVTFVDSDDYVEKDYIEKLMSGMSESRDLVCCNLPPTSHLRGKTLNDTQEMAQLFCEFGYTWGKLIRRSCIDITFHRGVWYAEDFIFYVHLIKNLRCIKTLDWNGYHYRVRIGSLSVKDKREKHTKTEFFRKNTFAVHYLENILRIDFYNKETKHIIKSHCYYTFCLLLLLSYRLEWQKIEVDKEDRKRILKLMRNNFFEFSLITGWKDRKFKRFLFGAFLLFMPPIGARVADYILE